MRFPAVDVAAWQKSARAALIKLIGLGQMRDELAGFEVRFRRATQHGGRVFTRRLCTIEPSGDPGAILLPHPGRGEGMAPLYRAPWSRQTRAASPGRSGTKSTAKSWRGRVTSPSRRLDAGSWRLPPPPVVCKSARARPQGRHGQPPVPSPTRPLFVVRRTPTAERVWDMQRILDWAVKQPEVDPKKIVMTGNSGGGVLTAYTAAIDTRVTVAIPAVRSLP